MEPTETPTPKPAAKPTTVLEKIALTLSAVFSPLLVPTYACAIALWITPLSLLSEKTRFFVSAIVFVITALVPLGVIIFMIRTGRVSDPAIANRRERGVPYVVTGLCYLLAAAFLGFHHAPHWLTFFFGGACFATLLAVVINTAWKISAHGTVMGGLCAMVAFIGLHGLGMVDILPWLSAAVLLSGAVGSSRLLLGRHTPMQVYAGWAMGFIVEYVFMVI